MGKVRAYGEHRDWTEREIQYLQEACERGTPQSYIAKVLGRTVSSVKSKRIKLGLGGMQECIDMLNLSEVAYLVGADRTSIFKTWIDNGLKARRKANFLFCHESDLFEFMKEHPHLWVAMECDYDFFKNQKWFIKRYNKEVAGEYKLSLHQKYKKWSAYELSRAKMLKRRGLTCREIAKEIGRTEMSVQHKLRRCI